jgi:hypothetical protein
MLTQLNRSVQESLAALENILLMDPSQAVIDLSVEVVETIHSNILKAKDELDALDQNELKKAYVIFFDEWKLLKKKLVEGWDIDPIRRDASSCKLSLLVVTQVLEEVLKKENHLNYLQFWRGENFEIGIIEALNLYKRDLDEGLKQLKILLHRCIYFDQPSMNQNGTEAFFKRIVRFDLNLAITCLDFFSLDKKDLKDSALICIFYYSTIQKFEPLFNLLSFFSSKESQEKGLDALFLNCHTKDPELGFRLIKKMTQREGRNRALGDLSLLEARKGRLTQAKFYNDMISSQALKLENEKKIREFEPKNLHVVLEGS